MDGSIRLGPFEGPVEAEDISERAGGLRNSLGFKGGLCEPWLAPARDDVIASRTAQRKESFEARWDDKWPSVI